MVGTTLADIRRHVESLASEDGAYYLVCGRTGDRPVPAECLRFESRAIARAGARAAEQYRSALRRYDPRLQYYDLIVCEEVDRREREGERTAETDDQSAVAFPPTDGAEAHSHRDMVEFCHTVAAAVFEELSDAGHDAVERAVMGAYFDLAETVGDPDDLCLRLLESMAAELDDRLGPGDQADVLAGAASRLAPPERSDAVVASTLAELRARGLLADYACDPPAIDLQAGTRTVVGEVSDYALAPRDGQLPVLPVVVELYRRRPDWPPSRIRVATDDDGCRLTVELAREKRPEGLASAPIRTGE